ncbi:MAG: GtrA family protein [Methylococcaceae bacterium]
MAKEISRKHRKIYAIRSSIYIVISRNFVKFILIGGFCASLNLILFFVFTNLLGMHYILSLVALTIIVNSIGFYLNKRYTFKSAKKSFLYDLYKYHLVMLSSLMISILFMYLLVDILNFGHIYSFLTVTVIMTVYNFLVHNKWTYK